MEQKTDRIYHSAPLEKNRFRTKTRKEIKRCYQF